ncbi:MBL fold metallo-hydrolase [Chryseobacterium sp. A301]
MFDFEPFAFNPFSENTYVLNSETQAWILDPGNSNEIETRSLFDFIESKNLTVEGVLLTHAHIDHVLGLQACVDRYKVPVSLHALEKEILARNPLDARRFGFEFEAFRGEIKELTEGEVLHLNDQHFEVLHVPGHSPGHVAFYSKQNKAIFSGDVLFQGSIGRTDLYKGDHPTLLKSIEEKLFTLDSDTNVYCGHGPSTNIGFEKQYNPYF